MATSSRQITIDEEYVATHPGSQKLYRDAEKSFPSGVTHDGRFLLPFPIYINRAEGARKWDVDGNEYIDLWSGHGSILLGHAHPELTAATVEQIKKGTHYGACTDLEVRWGELVRKMVPCAEEVKFVSSGTEATMMAMRLARAYTGRNKILKFEGHFHGWHDYATAGVRPPFDVPTSMGVPKETLSTMVVVPPSDIAAVKAALATGEIAAVIIEPAGAGTYHPPLRPGFLNELREATKAAGTVLIFDEVVTGFRLAPGGAQEFYKVTPDMCTMAKALVGGLPGGAVAGKADILNLFQFSSDAKKNRFGRLAHPGTFNATPVSAAMAVANLTILDRDRDIIYPHTYKMGAKLRKGLNQVIQAQGIGGACFGDTSVLRMAIGADYADLTEEKAMNGTYDAKKILESKAPAGGKLRRAWINEGIDMSGGTSMIISYAHKDAEIDKIIGTFDRVVQRLKAEGAFDK